MIQESKEITDKWKVGSAGMPVTRTWKESGGS